MVVLRNRKHRDSHALFGWFLANKARELSILMLAGVTITWTAFAAQQGPPADSRSKGDLVIVSLNNPTYPPLARMANITGDVELKLKIRKDGGIQSASALGGHPLLTQAALESAQRSNFGCRGCGDAGTVGSITYSFKIEASPGWPCPETSGARVTQSGNHITLTTEPALVHPYFSSRAAPSAKCLYLWACGSRWGGEDYYFFPVRSAKCLGLWKCGHQLREPFATCKALNRRLFY